MSVIIITTITKTEIQKLIENAVHKALGLQSPSKNINQESFLGVDEAASYLGIAKATLYGKCSKLVEPHFKQGKKLYFRQSELVKYLQSGKRNTVHIQFVPNLGQGIMKSSCDVQCQLFNRSQQYGLT